MSRDAVKHQEEGREMGGNALNHTSVRLTKKNYERMANECVARLQAAYSGKRIEALGSYNTKADFGDCDILIESSPEYDPHKMARAVQAVEIVRNGPVTSVGVVVRPEVETYDGNVFQVDFIKIEPEAFDFALGYFGRGDAGNLLGRLYHACGLAFRHDGLYYYFRDPENPDYKLCEILITQDFSKALKFMDYDPIVYSKGFNTKTDIYEFVASSRFFNTSIFLLENRNARSRVRDRKRPMYMEFLKWCEEERGLNSFEYPKDKKTWLPRLFEIFPECKTAFRKAEEKLSKIKAVKSKFNGQRASEITGLQGKDLGGLMKAFKESFDSSESQREFILKATDSEIEERVLAINISFLNDRQTKPFRPV